jgi:hypothetical protein
MIPLKDEELKQWLTYRLIRNNLLRPIHLIREAHAAQNGSMVNVMSSPMGRLLRRHEDEG